MSGPLIVRDSSTVLIDENGRKAILEELYSTHLSVEYMKAMSRGHFFWPNFQEELQKINKFCQAC